jgi:hypothetical protein
LLVILCVAVVCMCVCVCVRVFRPWGRCRRRRWISCGAVPWRTLLFGHDAGAILHARATQPTRVIGGGGRPRHHYLGGSASRTNEDYAPNVTGAMRRGRDGDISSRHTRVALIDRASGRAAADRAPDRSCSLARRPDIDHAGHGRTGRPFWPAGRPAAADGTGAARRPTLVVAVVVD